MLRKFFFTGFLMFSLLMLAKPSTAHNPQHVNAGDSDPGCGTFGTGIGFVDCETGTTSTGGLDTLATSTILPGDHIEWDFVGNFSTLHTVTTESSELAGTPGACGTGDNFDESAASNGDFFYHTFMTPGTCYYYCKFHGASHMRGVIIVTGPSTTTTTTRPGGTTTTTRGGGTTTTTTTRPGATTTTTMNHPPTDDSLAPVNISTVPSVAQSFTAGYSDPDGWMTIFSASLILTGGLHNERVEYQPGIDKFSMTGAGGNCTPGQATTLSDGYLTLNCASSSTFGSGNTLTVTFNVTPQPTLSGSANILTLNVNDDILSINRTFGTWTINRSPGAGSASPMNSATPVGTQQTFTIVYSDPDGYQNIAAANFYLSGNGGLHNEWLHYLAAPNLFTMMNAPGVCVPGQATTLSNGYLTLDCATSSISGSGTNLTVIFRVTPQAPSSGINYNIFNAASDQAGAAFGTFGGTWQIP